jgi:hypothetical protein
MFAYFLGDFSTKSFQIEGSSRFIWTEMQMEMDRVQLGELDLI